MKIFIAALDWGLGHTTRTIPVIDKFLKEGHSVVLGASNSQVGIYKEHFPELVIEKLPSTCPTYLGKQSQILSLLIFLPRFLVTIWIDHQRAKRIVAKYKIDKIISDNRYGIHTPQTFNVLITHQLSVKLTKHLEFLEPFVNRKITGFINHFQECYIPDYQSPNGLCGTLSNHLASLTSEIRFIGPQSRLVIVNEADKTDYPELLILISGPEKQRTLFENEIKNALKGYNRNLSYLIIRGLPNSTLNTLPKSMNHASASELKAFISHARYIICRSGYSTIMDLVLLNKTAMLIPTPGQTEQEYLAGYLEERNLFLKTRQNNIVIDQIISRIDAFVPVRRDFNFGK